MSDPNPDRPIICTNDPGACEAEWRAKGFVPMNLYVLRFYPRLIEDLSHRTLYALQFFRQQQDPQRELL